MVLTETIHPKYPDKGITIFSVMSALAKEHNAINLSQGFPDFEIEEEIKNRMSYAVQHGYNQYAPMAGLPDLQSAIAQKAAYYQSAQIDANKEITITPGATYAIFTALSTIIHPGDEVIILEPAYDSYIPNVYMNRGVPVCVPLNYPDFTVDWDKVRQSITSKTKAIIINNPHNPCGTVWSKEDMKSFEMICKDHDIFIIADEVYEHIVFDKQEHLSVLRYPELRKRSFVIGSFGKILQNTGWKIGYCIAPEALTQAFRKVHQYLAFSVNTPSQYAIASYLSEDIKRISNYASMLESKRNLFLQALQDSKWKCHLKSGGSYFQVLDYSSISSLQDKEFAVEMTKKYGVACIPISAFYHHGNEENRLVRFCFSKLDNTILQATNQIKDIEKL